MFLQRFLAAAAVVASSFVGSHSAISETVGQSNDQPAVSISNNSGGSIAVFALAAAEYLSVGTLVKFDGRCDSACTLFLGLPSKQTCINQGAFFRFHAPMGASARSERIAQEYLMKKYPGWVRSWINKQSGLSRNLITMDYNYASKFIQTCDGIASR
jgi:hypothetical protein